MILEHTGERLIEAHYQESPGDYLIYLFHLVTYNFARRYVGGKRALDYGCGSGYGTALLAGDCEHITGIDTAPEAINYAELHYQAPNLSYETVKPASEEPIPFSDAFFDTVLSFQVLEHIRDVKPYLSEIKRVLKPGGALILSTPDRSTRLLPFQKPWNIWHIKEYSKKKLAHILEQYFCNVEIQQMGGKQKVLEIELARTRTLMWLTLPFTLPLVPEIIRTGCLRVLKHLEKRRKTRISRSLQQFDFDESDLFISPNLSKSVNLIAVAYKEFS
jgi:2-polyprenyl-3-methyl-5-hydroxy-6-metoxy-1,4-benzoquinol methylase